MTRITYEVRDGVAEITLDNPPVNAITEPMVGELLAALARARADDSARAVILRSAVPRRFCAGLDLKVLDGTPQATVHALLEKLYPGLAQAQRDLGKPSIAAVSGAARGGGMTLAISCDMLVAGRSASFGYPEIDVGLLPAIHFTHLHRIVGRYRAFDLLFTARTFGADEALSLGLVNRVVDDDKVLDEARALAAMLAAKPAGAMRLGRAAFHRGADTDYLRGVAGAVETFCTVAGTDEARETVRGFAARGKG